MCVRAVAVLASWFFSNQVCMLTVDEPSMVHCNRQLSAYASVCDNVIGGEIFIFEMCVTVRPERDCGPIPSLPVRDAGTMLPRGCTGWESHSHVRRTPLSRAAVAVDAAAVWLAGPACVPAAAPL
jgi:hypothetical protein